MDNYQILPFGQGFQVVELGTDGRRSTVDGFATMADAQAWLDGFSLLLGLLDCMSGEPSRLSGQAASTRW
jgi:hypothetical protein